MEKFELVVQDWLGSLEHPARSTLGSVRITVGPIFATEVFDEIARTVRSHINVPALSISRWLVQNWWRLRWESERTKGSYEWALAHSMSAIGCGYAWPPLEISSDGEFVKIGMNAEPKADVAAVRYLSNLDINVPASVFERAVDDFALSVRERLSACRDPEAVDFEELLDELREERESESLARECRLQALAGMHPGDAGPGWIEATKLLEDFTGPKSLDEVAAVLPFIHNDPTEAGEAVQAIRNSRIEIDLSWLKPAPAGDDWELPWERGARLARFAREWLGLKPDMVINDARLRESLGLARNSTLASNKDLPLHGGYRNGGTHIQIRSPHPMAQRFELARLIGCALLMGPENPFLPVTRAYTATQKAERGFGQEFLCPWDALKAFVEEKGADEEAISDAASHFEVSEELIRTTLINKGRLSRAGMPL